MTRAIKKGTTATPLITVARSAFKRVGPAQIVHAEVPLGNMFGYATQLRSMTQGRTSYTMEFGHYQELPRNLAEEITAKRKS